jgi:hypothetical protein
MPVPNIFGTATSAIPLSQLDTNFATPVTIGNTAVQLGNTVTSFGNVTLTNVTISSGNVTVSAGSNTAPSITTVGDTNTGIFFPAADTIAFAEGGAESMRIDASGNMGLGVTPSAWSASFYKVIEGGDGNNQSAIAFRTDTNGVDLFANAYFNGTNNIYKYTGTAGFYQLTGNTHAWFAAPSGTAGDAITFTQAMTLNASGLLGIGQTSPQYPLHITGASGVQSYAHFTNATTGNTASDGFSIGVPAGFSDAYILQRESANLFFYTNAAERARIGSSGGLSIIDGLGVGTSTTFTNSIFFGATVLSAGAGTYPLKWHSGTGIVTYDTSSRLVKENIEDSPYGLTEVLQLKSRKYHRTDDQRNEIGFVADEVQTVMPEFVPLVAKSIFTKDEADTELIAGGVNYDKLTSVLVKAIQEQQAIITQLQADVAALKGTA